MPKHETYVSKDRRALTAVVLINGEGMVKVVDIPPGRPVSCRWVPKALFLKGYKPAPRFPVTKACELFAALARDVGATEEAIAVLLEHCKISKKDTETMSKRAAVLDAAATAKDAAPPKKTKAKKGAGVPWEEDKPKTAKTKEPPPNPERPDLPARPGGKKTINPEAGKGASKSTPSKPSATTSAKAPKTSKSSTSPSPAKAKSSTTATSKGASTPKSPTAKSAPSGKGAAPVKTAMKAAQPAKGAKTSTPVVTPSTKARAGTSKKERSATAVETGEKKTRNRGPTQASYFRELIMKGTMNTEQIFLAVQKKYNTGDDKRYFIRHYWNELRRAGKNPPPLREPKAKK